MPRRIKQIILFAGDVVLLYLSLWLALLVRYWGSFNTVIFLERVPIFTFVFFLWILVFFVFGLYRLNSVWVVSKSLRGFAGEATVSAALAVLFFYLVPYF